MPAIRSRRSFPERRGLRYRQGDLPRSCGRRRCSLPERRQIQQQPAEHPERHSPARRPRRASAASESGPRADPRASRSTVIGAPWLIRRARCPASRTSSKRLSTLSMQSSTVTRAMHCPFLRWNVGESGGPYREKARKTSALADAPACTHGIVSLTKAHLPLESESYRVISFILVTSGYFQYVRSTGEDWTFH
jgi:hypothetical protein